MRFHLTSWWAAFLLAFLTLLFGITFTEVASASSSASTGGAGEVRLGNLSETLTPVDIYVVSSSGATVAEGTDLSYGSFLDPQTVPAGTYDIDVRAHGASPTSKPSAVASNVAVAANRFYTIALGDVAGSGSSRRVMDLPDAATTPPGDASVQAIDAAYQNGTITFHCDYTSDPNDNVLTKATAGTADSDDMPAGNWTATVTASNGKTASEPLTLTADSTRTEIILDSTNGVTVLNLLDTVGDQPVTGFSTGLAPLPQPPGSPLPWLALIGAGGLLAVGCGVRLSRAGVRRPTSQR